jgi:hypothetical protein
MKNTLINRKATATVAKALDNLIEQVVFVGGAVVSLYIDDPAADDVRPTEDIDLTFNILTESDLEKLRQDLHEKGFTQSHEDEVICRFRLGDIKVDVMSTKAVGWAPANTWFNQGFEKAMKYDLVGFNIRLLPFAYFLASKFEAFRSRGGTDPRASHDFEDIVYLLNHTSNFPFLILNAGEDVRDYLVGEFGAVIENAKLQEAVKANLYFEELEERFEMILTKIAETLKANKQS